MKTGILVLTAVALTACAADPEPGTIPVSGDPVDVSVSEVAVSGDRVGFPGSVKARRQANIATRSSGMLSRIPVDVGSVVVAGQLLAELDAGEVQARIDAAQALVVLRERTHERIAALAADGAASDQELDGATAALAAARAQLSEAQSQDSYARLRAPFAGVVVARFAEPGDLAVPGTPIVAVAEAGRGHVEIDVPARFQADMTVGLAVDVVLSGSESVERGRVARVSPLLGNSSNRFRVEVDVPGWSDGSAPAPGSFARVEMVDPSGSTSWVPADAVVRRGQLTGVYVVRDDVLKLRWIRLGHIENGAVEVLSGLQAGDAVVRSPSVTFSDGLGVARATPAPWTREAPGPMSQGGGS